MAIARAEQLAFYWMGSALWLFFLNFTFWLHSRTVVLFFWTNDSAIYCKREMDSLCLETLYHIVSYLDHDSVAACRLASCNLRVVSRCYDGLCRFRRVVNPRPPDTLIDRAAATAAVCLPPDATLHELALPQEMRVLVAAHRLLWLSRQPRALQTRHTIVDAAIAIGIVDAAHRCTSTVWWDALHLVTNTLAHP